MHLRDRKFSRLFSRKSRNSNELELTPLIDVVFILLIFMVILANFSQKVDQKQEESKLELELARSKASQKAKSAEGQLRLYIFKDGTVKTAPQGTALAKISGIKSAPSQGSENAGALELWIKNNASSLQKRGVRLYSDRSLPSGSLLYVLSLFKRENISRIDMAVYRE